MHLGCLPQPNTYDPTKPYICPRHQPKQKPPTEQPQSSSQPTNIIRPPMPAIQTRPQFPQPFPQNLPNQRYPNSPPMIGSPPRVPFGNTSQSQYSPGNTGLLTSPQLFLHYSGKKSTDISQQIPDEKREDHKKIEPDKKTIEKIDSQANRPQINNNENREIYVEMQANLSRAAEHHIRDPNILREQDESEDESESWRRIGGNSLYTLSQRNIHKKLRKFTKRYRAHVKVFFLEVLLKKERRRVGK